MQLTGCNVQSIGSGAFTLSMLVTDLNTLKWNTDVGTGLDNTYLIVDTENGVREVGMNEELSSIDYQNALGVTEFIPDRTGPNLIAFSLDLENNLLNLTFDETIPYHGFIPSQHLAIRPCTCAGSSVLLSGTIRRVTIVPPVLTFRIDSTDSLKRNLVLANSRTDTYLTVETPVNFPLNVFRDTSFNPIQLIPISDALQVTTLIGDRTRPNITSFSLRFSYEASIMITFSERPSDIQTGELTLQSRPCGYPPETFRLTTATQYVSGSVVYLYLSPDETLRLKAVRNLAKSLDSTYLTATPNFMFDSSCNKVNPIIDCQALRADSFRGDSFRVYPNYWALDMDTGQIEMNFFDVVDLSTFNANYMFISSRDCRESYTLNSSRILNPTVDGSTNFTVQFSDFDLNNIKMMSIGTSRSNSYFSFTPGLIWDMFGNELAGRCRNVEYYTPDETSPNLRAVSFDMNVGQLSMTFDEPVSPSTFNASFVSIVNASSAPQATYNITGATVNSLSVSFVVNIRLSIQDLNNIKAIDNIATSETDTFIIAQYGTVRDVSGNAMNEALLLHVDSFVPDSTQPVVISFDLDLCSEQLVVYFDETINASSVDPTRITINASGDDPTRTPDTGTTTPRNGPSYNGRDQTESGSGSGSSSGSGDVGGGEHSSSGNYSEGDPTSETPTTMMMPSPTAPTIMITLTGGVASQENRPILIIRLTRNDVNSLVGNSTAERTFFTVLSGFIRDTNGNEVMPSSALQVESFTEPCPESAVLGTHNQYNYLIILANLINFYIVFVQCD